jgi:hypothetical protein
LRPQLSSYTAQHRLPETALRSLSRFLHIGMTLLAALLCAAISGSVQPPGPMHPALRALPTRMAWAWERPEDLR